MVMISIGLAGYIILAASRLPGLSYFAIYLSAAGIYPCIPNTIALTSTSIEGAYKRSVVMGWIISFGNINGAATTNVYLYVLVGDDILSHVWLTKQGLVFSFFLLNSFLTVKRTNLTTLSVTALSFSTLLLASSPASSTTWDYVVPTRARLKDSAMRLFFRMNRMLSLNCHNKLPVKEKNYRLRTLACLRLYVRLDDDTARQTVVSMQQ
jgi:hypothetical protein